MDAEKKYKYQTAQQALTQKDWAGGSPKPEKYKELIIGQTPSEEEITYAPAWAKVIDEPIVNATDHVIRCILEKLTKVTELAFTISRDASEVSIYNTGAGIPVVVHKEATKNLKLGHDVYVVEFIFGTLFQGSNTTKPEVTDDNVLETLIGGTNGIGIKLVNSFSTEFTVKTYDAERKLQYVQKWTNGMTVCERPQITPGDQLAAKERVPHTCITFRPDYRKFHTTMTPALAKQYTKLVRNRAIVAALYTNFACSRLNVRPPVVKFNSESLVGFKKTADVAKSIFPNAERISGTMTAGEKKTTFKLPWEITVVITPTNKLEHDNLTIVNGIVTHGGGHIKRAQACIVEAVRDSISGKINENDMRKVTNCVNNHTFIVLCCQIPNPSWTGQRKDVLNYTISRFDHYTIDAKLAKGVAKALTDMVQGEIASKAAAKESTPAGTKIIVDPAVYAPAILAGGPNWMKTALILTEGNSANASAQRGGLDRNLYGFLSTQGVPMNARKQSDVMEENNGRQYVRQTTKLGNNKGWNLLLQVTGLDTSNTYDVIKKLNYGVIIAMVDQDHDGKGNILGLILSTFAQIWPNLIRCGYIKWFATPIIRAFPKSQKGRVWSFYNEHTYEQWSKSKDSVAHNVRYYKGLGTHNDREIKAAFKTMYDHLYTFTYDDQADKYFNIYFGSDPNKRKVVLSRPMRVLSPAEQDAIDQCQEIPCSMHLSTDTDWYQRDNLERKLSHVIDGQNQAGRKILNSLIHVCGISEPIKVAQFAGEVGRREDYHHGEASLENSIFGRGLICVGSNQLPFVQPFGSYGSRSCGGAEHASARYGYLKPNERLLKVLFPPEDYYMLDFNFVDGKRKEPKYFVPIVPLVVCESVNIPAHGWRIELWARDLLDVIEYVRIMIMYDDDSIPWNLTPYAYRDVPNGYTGEIRTINGNTVSYGNYKWIPKKNQIIVTELPLRVWTNDYVAAQQKKIGNGKVIDIVNDNTDVSRPWIIIQLEPGAYNDIMSEYSTEHHNGVIEYFKLRNTMHDFINLMGTNGSVMQMSQYSDAVREWYQHRKQLYWLRAERREIVLELKAMYYRNIVRYIETANDNKFARRKISEMEDYLSKNKYDKMHSKYVNNVGFMENSEIHEVILGPKANYNYLIDLRDRDKSEESLNKYKEKLAAIQAEYANTRNANSLGRFPGSDAWITELTELEIVYHEGTTTKWTFGEDDNLVYD